MREDSVQTKTQRSEQHRANSDAFAPVADSIMERKDANHYRVRRGSCDDRSLAEIIEADERYKHYD